MAKFQVVQNIDWTDSFLIFSDFQIEKILEICYFQIVKFWKFFNFPVCKNSKNFQFREFQNFSQLYYFENHKVIKFLKSFNLKNKRISKMSQFGKL